MHIQLDYSSQDLIDSDDVESFGLVCCPCSEALVIHWHAGGTTYFRVNKTNDVWRAYQELKEHLKVTP